MSTESLLLREYEYDLPDEKIAKYPPTNRSDSKLLVYHQGKIEHRKFIEIHELLPKNCLLVFNDTKVIPARMIFEKETGAKIEIFLLAPKLPSTVHETVMLSLHTCTWQVMIGNAKRWKSEIPLLASVDGIKLSATRVGTDEVQFDWESDFTFSDILARIGNIPLPPYLGRDATEEDVPRYQTVYSKAEGAVAAPTAGLHFTQEVLENITKSNITTDYVTLHVSAGTFQPIKVENVTEHPMHREQIIISQENIKTLLDHTTTIPVGTTSMRTLESLFWYGQLLCEDEDAEFFISKETAYSFEKVVSKEKSLTAVLQSMNKKNIQILAGSTEIFIYPGYQMRMCDGLITNFHQPGSTLMLLVATLIGKHWKEVYASALKENYRFLSYGDSSLLLP